MELIQSPNFFALREAFLRTLQEQNAFPPTIVGIVENNRRARQLQDVLLAQGVPVAPVVSWDQLFRQLFAVVDTRVPVPHTEVLETLLQVWWRQHPEFADRLYLPVGLLERLYRFFDIWFAEFAPAEHPLPAEGEPLVTLYQEFRHELGDDFADAIAIYQRCQEVPLGNHPAWQQVQQVVVEVPRPLRAVYRLWLAFLQRQGVAVQVFLHYGANSAVFGDMQATHRWFTTHAHQVRPLETPTAVGEKFLVFEQSEPHSPRAFVLGLPNRLQEVRWVARKIRQLVMDSGVALNHIAVTATDMPAYRPIVENTFGDFAIPLQGEINVPLMENPVIQAMMQLVACAANQETVSSIIPLLESPWLNFHQELKGLAVEEQLRELRVPQGVNALREQARRMLQYYRGARAEDEDLSPEAEQFARLDRSLAALQVDLQGLAACTTPQAFVQFLLQFIENHHLMDRAVKQLEHSAPRQAAENFRALREWIQVLDNWQKRCRLEEISIIKFFQMLQLLAQTTTYARPFVAEGGVQWLAPDHVLDAGATVVFVLGMSESHFPQAARPALEGIPRDIQQMLADETIHRQRRWLTALLDAPESETFFLYPLREGESEQIPSVYLQELMRLGAVVSLDSAELPVPDPVDWQEYRYHQLVQGKAFSEEPAEHPGLAPPDKIRQAVTILLAQENLKTTPTAFEGNLQAVKGLQQPLETAVNQRVFSPSALERYARCPMQYFLRYELRLPETLPREEFLSPLEKGNLVHTVVYRFYTEHPPEERSWQSLEAIARQEFERLPLPPNFWRQFLERQLFGTPRSAGLFGVLFEQLQQLDTMLQDSGLLNIQAEQPFGLPGGGWPALELPQANASIRLRGKIDRIDVGAEGQFVVIDYKTGTPPSATAITAGESLQLPVYVMAAQNFLATRGEPLAAGFVPVGDEKQAVRWVMAGENSPFSVRNGGEMATVIQTAQQAIARYVAEIRQGVFVHTDDPSHCRGCSFVWMCRRYLPKMQARRRNSSSGEDGS